MQPIFDSHSHAFPDHLAASAMKALMSEPVWMPIQHYHDGTVAGLLASMDRAAIERTILCSIATRPTQVTKITDWSAAIASDRLIPFASIHPDYPHPEAEVERIASLGLKGLKFHPQYMNCPVDDPRILRICRAAAKANLAVTIHGGHDLAFPKTELGSPQSLRALHEAVPDLRLLACHMGGWQRWEEVLIQLAGQRVYLETSYCLGQCPEDLLLKIIERHPWEYLLFGSDSPWADQVAELQAFDRLPLPRELKRAACWENVFRFANLPQSA